jgi:hypothetical protein
MDNNSSNACCVFVFQVSSNKKLQGSVSDCDLEVV